MKFLLLSLVIARPLYAQVIDLGTLDSRGQMLDQRYVINPSKEERENSLRTFFIDRELDFNKEFQSQEEMSLIKPDEEWIKLIEGHL